jgi:hypothetical protein
VYYNENMNANSNFKRDHLQNYNDLEHAVKTKQKIEFFKKNRKFQEKLKNRIFHKNRKNLIFKKNRKKFLKRSFFDYECNQHFVRKI